MPAQFETFFLASAGASAGLIGLLFVAVSVAPEKVFGTDADAVRQAQALSAFTALANVFFISMASLIPEISFGIVVTIVAIPSALQTLALLRLVRHWRGAGILYRGAVLFLGSAAIYASELFIGLQAWSGQPSRGELEGLTQLMLGAYAIGLGRAWELLGAPRTGFIPPLISLFRRKPPEAKS